MLGNPLEIGSLVGSDTSVTIPASARGRHMYVCGGTGVGKSKFLEECIRQDILNWRDSHCGLILLDPHGLVYQNTMRWLARHEFDRPVIPIDLRRNDWIIAYNLLRPRNEADPSVVVSSFVRALAHVWGADGTDDTPLFARWATVFLLTLYQNRLTLADLTQLLAREDIRRSMIAQVTDEQALYSWQRAAQGPRDFYQEITSTLNRFQRLYGPAIMKATLGQSDVSMDLKKAIDDGAIILVNLATEGSKIDEVDTKAYATILLTDLWSAAKDRGKREGEETKPFYVYIDECQEFITPIIAKSLDQARGFGLHLTLANQYPTQFLNEGPSGKAMYDSILTNARTKIVFRIEHPEDSKTLAQSLFMSTFDTKRIKHILMSTKVMGYKEETREIHSTGTTTYTSRSRGRGGGSFAGNSAGTGEGTIDSYDPSDPSGTRSRAESWNTSITSAWGMSNSWQEQETEGEAQSENTSTVPMLIPQMGQEVSSVQFSSIEEQLFEVTQSLFDQDDRHFAIRYHGGPKAPLFVTTPTVTPADTSYESVEQLRLRLLSGLPYALPMPEATSRLQARKVKLLNEVVNPPAATLRDTARRRVM